MYRTLPLLGDIGLSILCIIFVSDFFGRYEPAAFWLIPIILLPDLDAIPELWKRGKVASREKNPEGHNEFLHKPLAWLLATGLLWWSIGFYGAIIFAITLAHFLHDSFLTGWGIAWLAPFSDTKFKFFVDNENEVSFHPKNWLRRHSPKKLKIQIIKYGDDNWIENIYFSFNVVTILEYGTFIISLIMLIRFI